MTRLSMYLTFTSRHRMTGSTTSTSRMDILASISLSAEYNGYLDSGLRLYSLLYFVYVNLQ